MFLETYELDPAPFLTISELVLEAALKMTKAQLNLLTDIGILLMIEKGVEVEYVTLFIDMQKLIANT